MTVSREDIERKAQELAGAVDQTTKSVKNVAIVVAIVAAGIVAAAFIMGRRRGSRNKTVVEVYKV
ncbi:MAG: hypothetical protein WAL25_15180 [Acidimicrobiia bacterium]